MSESFLNNKKQIGILFFFLSLILFALMITYSFLKPSLTYDDFYSLGIIRYSFMDMINATAINVHPPLSYIILKTFAKIFNPVDNQGLIYVGKFVSALPISLLLVLSITKIRKEFGFLVAGLFAFLICSSTSILYYGTVIRMYSWALLFLTVQLVYFYDIINRKSAGNAWIMFTIASICGIYTHYFTAISVIIIYFLLLAYLIYLKKDQLKNWILSAIASFVSYLPWIGILFNQVSAVKNDYWIKEITINNVFDYFNFIFAPSDSTIGIILEILVILAFLVLICYGYKNKRNDNNIFGFSLVSLSVIFLTIIAGIVLSILIRPIFISRYILPACGGVSLAFSLLISKSFDNKKIFYLAIALILVLSTFGAMNFIEKTNLDYSETVSHDNFFNSINDGKVVVFDDKLSYLRYSPFLENDTCIYNQDYNAVKKEKENMIIFNKKPRNLEGIDYNLEKIYRIYQDDVYLIK